MNHKEFLESEFIKFCKILSAKQLGKWGKMNAQQMIEHFSDSVKIASGKTSFPLQTPSERLEAVQNFVKSDKQFRENTPNNLISDEPPSVRNETIEKAVSELEKEIEDFYALFHHHPDKIVQNPFFGDLNFELWQKLLAKHALHHSKQFGYNPEFNFANA